MGRQKSDLANQIDDAIDTWTSVNREADPVEWKAWIEWRRRELRCQIEPDNLTVPTPFPPTTVAGARDYIEVLRKIRRLDGWKEARARLPDDVRAFGIAA